MSFSTTDLGILMDSGSRQELPPTLGTIDPQRDVFCNPFYRAGIDLIDIDLIQPERIAVTRQGQDVLPSSLDQLKIVDLSVDARNSNPNNFQYAYLFRGHTPWFDADSTIGLSTNDDEILAVASSFLCEGHVVVLQIQGSITNGVDFKTGLTYKRARRLISGFDWRSTFLSAYEVIAKETGNVPAVLPNGRNQWNEIKLQENGAISYDDLAINRGYVYDPVKCVFVKPRAY